MIGEMKEKSSTQALRRLRKSVRSLRRVRSGIKLQVKVLSSSTRRARKPVSITTSKQCDLVCNTIQSATALHANMPNTPETYNPKLLGRSISISSPSSPPKVHERQVPEP